MSIFRSLFTILLVATVLNAQGEIPRPSACVAPEALASSLKAVSDQNWNAIDEKKLQMIWPTEIDGIECASGACQAIGRRDRVINNKCQCCELFRFNIERNESGEVTNENLHTIVIYHSALNRATLLKDSKMLSKALGLPDSDVATISFKESQKFDWTFDQGKQPEVSLLEISLYQQSGVWTAYFYVSRQSL